MKLAILSLFTVAAFAQSIPAINVKPTTVTITGVPATDVEQVVILCLKKNEADSGPETREITGKPENGVMRYVTPKGYAALKIAVYLRRDRDPHNPYVFHPGRTNPDKWER